MLSARDIREFRGFLGQATNRQVQSIYDKEKRAGRDDYADLASAEARRRRIFLDDQAEDEDESDDEDDDDEVEDEDDEEADEGNDDLGTIRGQCPVAAIVISKNHSTKKKTPAQLDREIASVLGGGSRPRGGRNHASTGGTASLMATIHAGCRVTIVDRFGKPHTGKAVMRGPYGWVLNMSGKHGNPAIANDDNIVSVRC